jgi:putative ATPase
MELFELQGREPELQDADSPLAWRMRPGNLEEFVGQKHLLDQGKILWRIIKSDRLSSLVFYGPPGCGKTALAQVIAGETRSHFSQLNAVTAGVGDLKKLKPEAARLRRSGVRTILFLDEIHRFNRAQQDVLLPLVETGLITLIGASTHNPFFAIIPPLASRLTLVRFEPLGQKDLGRILDHTLEDSKRGLGSLAINLTAEARRFLISSARGDARRMLTALEIAAHSMEEGRGKKAIGIEEVRDSMQTRALVYDQDEHYDTISAFIKSIRGSDPDAALFWLAKMIEAGEDPLFIARRIVIAAAEDVGLADPMALVVAQAAAGAVMQIGLPEGRIPLSEAALYVALAPKSNAAYVGIKKAQEDIRSGRSVAVPPHLRDTSYHGAGKLGHGRGYRYPHDYPGHWVKQSYMPHEARYYNPTGIGLEADLKARISRFEQKKRQKSPQD